MANVARSVTALFAAAILAACSSEGVGPAPQAQGLSNGARHGARGSLVLRIHVPRKKKTGRAAPRYISPSTQAITIAITGPIDVKETAALTPGAKGCSNGSCTITIPGLKLCPASANCYVATIATYDAVTGCPSACAIPVTAHELSANQVVEFTIAKARANQINVTLDGIPISLVLQPAADATLSGNTSSGFSLGKCNSPAQHVDVLGVDADNNYILGVGAPTPSLVSNDSVDLPVTASSSSPNRFTLTPPGTAAAGKVVQLTMGATPLAGSGASPVTTHVNVTFSGGLCGFFVADFGHNAVKEILTVDGSIPQAPTIGTLGSGFNSAESIGVDSFGNVYVADLGNNAVKEILAVNGSIPALPTIKTLGSGFNSPNGVAIDGSGNVYVADAGNNAVKEIEAVNGSIPASPTIKTLGSGFLHPVSVAVDRSGNIYVADEGHNAVEELFAPNFITKTSFAPVFSGPTGVAVDGSGNVYVADSGHNAVKEMLSFEGSVPASPTVNTLGFGFSNPFGVAVDESGNVYIADSGHNAVKEILAVNGSIPASPGIVTLGSGFSSPTGVALR